MVTTPAERGGTAGVACSDPSTTLVAALGGAAWAWTAIYRDVHPRLLRYLRARQAGSADDLASEVWLDVAGGIGGFQGGDAAFRAWVFTIARCRLIDARRKTARRRTDVVDPDLFVTRAGPAADDPESRALSAVDAQSAADRIAAVLTPDQADVVLLRILGDLAVAQVADILGKQASAVRVLQHRALRRLAEAFPLRDWR